MAGGEIVGALHDLSTCPGTAPRASLAARGADSHRSLSRHRPADRAGFEAVRRASWPSRGRSSSASSAWTWPRQPSSWVTSRAAAGNSGWRSSQPLQSCWTCHAFALGGTVDPLACRGAAVSARANCSEPSRRSLPASCWSAFPDWTCGTSSSRLRSTGRPPRRCGSRVWRGRVGRAASWHPRRRPPGRGRVCG